MGPMPIAAEINGRLYAIHTDQLNTPRQLTDENGQEVWQWAISGFGEVEPTTAETGWIRARNGSAGQIQNTLPVAFNLRFPGQQFDEETGLHYNHHRYYDPYLTVGYTEADPLGLQAGWNRFLYVDGDPLGTVDPEGLLFMSTLGGAQRNTTLEQAATYGAPGNVAMSVGMTSAAAGAVILPAGHAAGKALIIPAAATTRELWRRTNFDGPTPGLAYGNGRICQIRFNKKPLLRLDYQAYPGTKGNSRLHLNVGTEGTHVPLDPRRLFD